MKKLTLLIIAFSLFAVCVIAQTSGEAVQIKDIYVQPITGIDSISTYQQLELMFKMNNPESASLIHVQFGTSQNIGDVLTIDASIIEQDGQYYALYNGEQEIINGYETIITVELIESQASTYNFITLFVEDNNGELSNKLYFTK